MRESGAVPDSGPPTAEGEAREVRSRDPLIRPASPGRSRGFLLEALLLGAAFVPPFLPAGAGALCMAALAGGWLALGPPRREAVLAGSALFAAALVLAAGWLWGHRPAPAREGWVEAAREPYVQLWEGLKARGAAAAAALPELPRQTLPGETDSRQQVFDHLAAVTVPGRTFVLLDRSGQVWAWAGDGLLHQVDPFSLPREGFAYRSSFGSSTLLHVTPIGDDGRPWRLVVGRTLPADRLPFNPPGSWRPEDFRWSLVDRPSQADSGAWVLAEDDLPDLVVEPRRARPAVGGLPWARPLALACLALALLGLAVLRGVGVALRPAAPGERQRGVELLGLGGVGAAAFAATSSVLATAALLAGLAIGARGLRRGRPRTRAALLVALVAAGTLLLFAAAWGAQRWQGEAIDLAADLTASPVRTCLRLATWAAAFGILLVASRHGARSGIPSDRWAWTGALLLGTGAALHEIPAAALTAASLGAAAAALWLAPPRPLRRFGTLAVAAALASLLAAGAWETAYRLELRTNLGERILPRMAPPSEEEMRRLGGELQDHFARLDLKYLGPRTVERLDPQDLAFLLWRRSPLARRNAVSALVVEPEAEVPSSFAYGLSVTPDLDRAVLPSDLQGLPAWDALGTQGVAALTDGGEVWGRLRYWLKPRPGFRLDERALGEGVAAGLLGGGEPPGTWVEGLPAETVYGLYSRLDGRALLTPWEEAPPLPGDIAREVGGGFVVETPAGSSWAFARAGSDGWEVLFLPRLLGVSALERVLTHAAGTLALVLLGGLLVVLLALPRPAVRDLLQQAVRSYSKRLLIVYTLLVLVPLPLLNFTLIAGVKERLWEQRRAAGEGALVAAQRYLGQQLENLPVGSAIDFTSAEQLRQLAGIVRHDLNLYYGSRETRVDSSRPELFSAGLLPKRVPGEVFSRLALGGYNLTSRTRTAGETDFVELYAPLRLSGESTVRFFLSVPLLAQQKAVAAELAHLRRQAILVTALLFVFLAIASARLARGFAAPITQLVEGTRRIARGASSLDMAPADLELAALVQAVDEMAARIALGRQRLVREKQVVERMVEHITSGVVSLDEEGRVLMHNRVAQELIGVEIGGSLAEAVAGRERMVPLAEFLEGLDDEGGTVQKTVRLPEEDGQEREWSLVWVPIPGGGEPSALLVVDDATEVLRGQRLEAWAEMARIIAHEIKNPLTPIRLSAEHMKQVHTRDPAHFDDVFERCNANILRQVDELQQIAREFSTYSSILTIDPQPGDLGESLGTLVESYQAAPPPGITVTFDRPPEPVDARFDARLLGRAVRNLLENAVRASAGGGEVAVHLERGKKEAKITVTDTGPGVDPGLLGRIFDPYFSTHDTGTGLGLPISRRIVEEHGGTITARNRPTGGLEVEMTIPVS